MYALYLPNDTEYEYELRYEHVTPGQVERTGCRNDDAQPGFDAEVEIELPFHLVHVACWVNNCPMTLEAMKELEEQEIARVCQEIYERPDEEYDPT